MTNATDKAICAIIAMDATISPRQAQKALDILRGVATIKGAENVPLKRAEVAALFGVCKQTVTNWARRGKIHPIRLGEKGKGAIGYLRQDVEKILRTAV